MISSTVSYGTAAIQISSLLRSQSTRSRDLIHIFFDKVDPIFPGAYGDGLSERDRVKLAIIDAIEMIYSFKM